ncbi:MAG: hypothetical protein U1U88_001285 [Lawsonella clevelandensis]
MRTTLDPIPTLPVGGSYVVGIDAGQNSVGLFALALTAEGVRTRSSPCNPSSMMVAWTPTKLRVTRLAKPLLVSPAVPAAGYASKKRLDKLDKLLDAQGWHGRQEAEFPTQIWEDRYRATSSYIEDDEERARFWGKFSGTLPATVVGGTLTSL